MRKAFHDEPRDLNQQLRIPMYVHPSLLLGTSAPCEHLFDANQTESERDSFAWLDTPLSAEQKETLRVQCWAMQSAAPLLSELPLTFETSNGELGQVAANRIRNDRSLPLCASRTNHNQRGAGRLQTPGLTC